MEDAIEIIVTALFVLFGIGGAIAKKMSDARARAGQPAQQKPAYAASQDDVKAFLREMGVTPAGGAGAPRPPQAARPVAPPPASPRVVPVAPAAVRPQATAAPGRISAAEALRVAAAKRARTAAQSPVVRREPSPAAVRKARPRVALGQVMPAEAPVAAQGAGMMGMLSRLPAMQQAVVLRELLGSPPGLSRGPFEREE